MKEKLLNLEQKIFNCKRCDFLYKIRKLKIQNCPALGFGLDNYLNAKVCSICEVPGSFKPKTGEVLIEKLEDFHKHYDDRIKYKSLIGKRLFTIYSAANLTWNDVQHFNTVCCANMNNQVPTFTEVDNCKEFLLERINLLQNVKVIIAFGSITKDVVEKFDLKVPVIYSHHPSYLFAYMKKDERQKHLDELVLKIKAYV